MRLKSLVIVAEDASGDKRFIWLPGDELSDLEHALTKLQGYLDTERCELATAIKAQKPIETECH